MNKKTVLFIGRFQPFHKGHLGTIQKIAQEKDVEELIIGIGSSDKSFTSYNPFTAEEREVMIRASLNLESKENSLYLRERVAGGRVRGRSLPITLVHIPDIPDNDEWTKVLQEKYFDGQVVYSGNSLVIELLTNAGKEVRTPPQIDNPSGTEIRRLIVEGKNWEEFVPKEVVKLIKKNGGEQRLQKIFIG